MTELLQQAIARASQLDAGQQDALASLLLGEMESEERWNDAFAGSQDALATLASEALEEHARGETKPLVADD